MKIRDRIKEFRRVKASDIAPNPKNWRTHPKGQQDALKGILAEIGYAGALIAREMPDGSLMLIDGHLRAETTPGIMVPVLVLDVTEAEADKLLATLDPLAAMAGADAAKLDALLASVKTDSGALQEMLDGLKDANPTPVEPGGGGDEFDTTVEDGPTRAKAGDLWVIGGKHRLLVGDCTVAANIERLMAGAKADAVVTDPPYGVDFKRGQYIADSSRVAKSEVPDSILGDGRKAQEQADFIAAVFAAARPHCRPGASVHMFSATLAEGCYSMLGLLQAGVHVQSQLVWAKNNLVLGIADYHWKHEICWYGWFEGAAHVWHGGRDKTTLLEFARVQATFHPNEKPVALIGHMIENVTVGGEAVYEPFMGSGTAMIAAHRLGRACYGCELDPKYADVILKRAEAEGMTCERMTT